MRLRHDLPSWIGACLAAGGLVWLYPLMADQLVLFADQEQTARAETARAEMLWPALLLAAGSGVVAARGYSLHGAIAALPLVAVVLALAMPDLFIQFFAYAFSAPVAIGSLLAAVAPLVRHGLSSVKLLAGAAVIALLVVLADVVVLLACIGVLAWVALSRLPSGRTEASALD